MISLQNSCKDGKDTEFKLQTISLIAHENICTRLSKIIKNLICIIFVLIGAIIAMVAGIIYTINQYDLEQQREEQVNVNSDLSNNNGRNLIFGGNYYGEGNNNKETSDN